MEIRFTKKIGCIFLIMISQGIKTTAQTIPSFIPANSLVGCWPFNGNANDESGNGNHGTVNGATLTGDRNGNMGKAYNFSRSLSNNISFNNNLVGNGNASMAGWFFLISPAGGPFVHIGADNSIKLYCSGYSVGLGSTSFINCNSLLMHASCLGYNYTGFDTNVLTWVYFILIRQGNSLTTYINGINISTITISDLKQIDKFAYFGSTYLNNSYFFNGKLDNIAILNRVLSENEIKALYNAGAMHINLYSKTGAVNFNG